MSKNVPDIYFLQSRVVSMNNFFKKMIYKIRSFMNGRYGFDELSKFLIISGLVMMMLSSLFRIRVLYYLSAPFYIIGFVRCFSFNFYSRQRERTWYLSIKRKITNRLGLYKKIFSERKQYRYFKCKNCGAYWRVPKGRGRVEISCRNCKTKMIKKA